MTPLRTNEECGPDTWALRWSTHLLQIVMRELLYVAHIFCGNHCHRVSALRARASSTDVVTVLRFALVADE